MWSFKKYIESRTDMLDQLEEADSQEKVIEILDGNGVEYWTPKTLRPLVVFNMLGTLYVIDSFEFVSPVEANRWIYDRHNDIEEYINCGDFNDSFWQGAARTKYLYHGTSQEAWKEIQESGIIEPQNRTRGIGNRGTGLAIFLSESLEYVKQHYGGGVILAIDVSRMKADGFAPYVSREGPIERAECLSSLANLIGIEDFSSDEESGIEADTVVVYKPIPLKYIRKMK